MNFFYGCVLRLAGEKRNFFFFYFIDCFGLHVMFDLKENVGSEISFFNLWIVLDELVSWLAREKMLECDFLLSLYALFFMDVCYVWHQKILAMKKNSFTLWIVSGDCMSYLTRKKMLGTRYSF